jgi:hypothetical protein
MRASLLLVADEFELEPQRAEVFEGNDLESDQRLTKPTSPIRDR